MSDQGLLQMGTTRGRWVLFATVLGSSLALLDATVVNVALQRIGTTFGAGFAALQWTVNAYTLTLASLILLGGSLGDRFGRRRVFLIGVAWFAVASLLCGLAPSVEALIGARALQGVGGALLTPGSLAIISAAFRGSDRAQAVGAWSGLGGIAAAVGPFLGGWLIEWSWRAVFLINLPVAAAVIAVTLRHVPESKDPTAAPTLDLRGPVLAVLGLGGLTYGLTEAGHGASPAVLSTIAVGVIALVAFVVLERRSTHPLVPTALFRSVQFTAANIVTFLVYAAIGVFFVLLVLHLQVVAGFSPLLSGTAMLPVTVLMLAFSARSGKLAQQIGPRLPMTLGPLICAVGVLLTLRIGPHASYLGAVLPAVTLFGAGLTLTVAPLTATVLDSADDRYAGAASGVNNAVARTAGLLAVAVVPVLAGMGSDYTDRTAFAASYHVAAWIMAGLMATGGVLAALLIRRTLGPAEDRIHLEECSHCAVTGPQVYPESADSAPGE